MAYRPFWGLIHERDSVLGNHLVKSFHIVFDARDWTGGQRTFIDDLLLADLAPAGLLRRITSTRCSPRDDSVI
jgi:hypothetical protein